MSTSYCHQTVHDDRQDPVWDDPEIDLFTCPDRHVTVSLTIVSVRSTENITMIMHLCLCRKMIKRICLCRRALTQTYAH
jgi:hypothetical protein